VGETVDRRRGKVRIDNGLSGGGRGGVERIDFGQTSMSGSWARKWNFLFFGKRFIPSYKTVTSGYPIGIRPIRCNVVSEVISLFIYFGKRLFLVL
jgi:hypothetical protein